MSDIIPVVKSSFLTAEQFEKLSDVPPEIEWLANITNQKTRRGYKIDVSEFSLFTGIRSSEVLRTITRAHVIAWRKDLVARELYTPRRTLFPAGAGYPEPAGVKHVRIKGKRDRIRFLPVHPVAVRLIEEYLTVAGHGNDASDPLVRAVKNNGTGDLDKALDPGSVYTSIVRKYGLETGISAEVNGLCVHSLRATAATNALSHDSDIARVQEWMGHANVSTTQLYDRRKTRPEERPTFRVKY
jgi:site-specific recombinase XerD